MVTYKREKNLKELLTRADHYNTINIVEEEIHIHVPCNKRFDSCTNFVVTKSSFECFTTKIIYKFRRSTSCVSNNAIYIAFCLSCLKRGVGSIVDCNPGLRN